MSLLVGGFNHHEKYEFVSWDDGIPNILWKNKIHVPNHQTGALFTIMYLLVVER